MHWSELAGTSNNSQLLLKRPRNYTSSNFTAIRSGTHRANVEDC